MNFFTLRYRRGALEALDQTALPKRRRIVTLKTSASVAEAIRRLQVRGAPAIGIAGAYAVALACREIRSRTFEEYLSRLIRRSDEIARSRPTAVNLRHTVERVLARVSKEALNERGAYETALREARRIHEEDRELCLKIGRSGLPLIRNGDSILVHCNAGALATGGIGTALAPLYLAKKKGVRFSVFACETRPLLQGARLTVWELLGARIPCTLICDSAAALLMARGRVTRVLIGADRIARNGDTANKVGSYGLAVLARRHRIPFYVASPRTSFDPGCRRGGDIPIEERHPDEVRGDWAPSAVRVFNPAFDVTPHELISGFITDAGLLRPPYTRSLKRIFGR